MQITSQERQRATPVERAFADTPIYPRDRSSIDAANAWSDTPHHVLEECDAIVVTLPLSPADHQLILALYNAGRPFSVTVR